MKSLAEIYQTYASGNPHGPGTGDKGTVHSYIEVYEELFAPYRQTATNFLEIGVLAGSSIRMWTEYFNSSKVHGVDVDERPLNGLFDLRPMVAEGFNLSFFDASLPDEVEKHFKGVMFDVIIDDASHHIRHQLDNYKNFRSHLSKGGIYVIEDVADIDAHRSLFENLDSTKHIKIYDRRNIKGRFDDVLVVLTDKP
jgi:cephalosporin hydroxylase